MFWVHSLKPIAMKTNLLRQAISICVVFALILIGLEASSQTKSTPVSPNKSAVTKGETETPATKPATINATKPATSKAPSSKVTGTASPKAPSKPTRTATPSSDQQISVPTAPDAPVLTNTGPVSPPSAQVPQTIMPSKGSISTNVRNINYGCARFESDLRLIPIQTNPWYCPEVINTDRLSKDLAFVSNANYTVIIENQTADLLFVYYSYYDAGETPVGNAAFNLDVNNPYGETLEANSTKTFPIIRDTYSVVVYRIKADGTAEVVESQRGRNHTGNVYLTIRD
jgi:hypothetical protein